MQHLKIVQQRDKTYPCAAIDQQTGGVVLRHHDDVELLALCHRLEWKMDDAERERNSLRGSSSISS